MVYSVVRCLPITGLSQYGKIARWALHVVSRHASDDGRLLLRDGTPRHMLHISSVPAAFHAAPVGQVSG